MSRCETLLECFRYSDWARDKLLELATGLTAAQLDEPFEMGAGSLRATLQHLYGAERVWFERWQGTPQPQFPPARDLPAVEDLSRAWHALGQARDHRLLTLADDGLETAVQYTNPDGQRRSVPLGDILLHVGNHGVHHRAQALNMLRRLGVKVPGLDYLFIKCERPTIEYEAGERAALRAMGFAVSEQVVPSPPWDLGTIRAYYRYNDWAQQRVLAAAEPLGDVDLDRPFEIGLGTLRRTLLHLRDAEQWWLDNWTRDAPGAFAQLPESTTMAELKGVFTQTAAARNAHLAGLTNEALQRVTAAEVRPGVRLRFRLGETMLQLCAHGTHHRAQALNMLRHVAAPTPPLDYVAMWLEIHGG